MKGVLTDPSGAPLHGAEVTLLDVGRGLIRKANSGPKGEYRFAALPPTTYDLDARYPGFEKQVKKGVVITVGQTVIIDFGLQLAPIAVQVSATTEVPLIETEKAQQANTIGERYIRELPIDRRDYLTFTLLAPGVADAKALADNSDFRVAQAPQSGLSFYGSNGRGNNVTVDGSEANDDVGGVRPNLSQEAVQEFQINRSNYSAEFGEATGGVINIVSKSGNNRLRGSLYGFFRNDSLDARNPFAVAPPSLDPFIIGLKATPAYPPSNRQQYGATLGLPVRRNKSFLFLAFEGLRRNESGTVTLLTDTSIFAPTPGQNAILAGLQAQGNNVSVPCLSGPPATNLPAATCASVLSRILTVDPTVSGPPKPAFAAVSEPFLVNLFARNSGTFPFAAHSDQFSVRFDHLINERNQLFVRYNFTKAFDRNSNFGALVGFSRGNLIKQFDSTMTMGWFREFSQRLQNELRAMWSDYDFKVSPNDPLGPGINIAGFGFFNRDLSLPSFTTGRHYELANNVSMSKGKHAVRWGEYLLLRGNKTESHTFFGGRFNFGSLSGNLLSPCLGAPSTMCGVSAAPAVLNALQAAKLGLPQFYQQGFGNPTVDSLLPLIAAYGQDTWEPHRNIKLTFGLRYELDKRRAPLHTDTNNAAPRFSFSWDPLNDRKTVFRGGYGIYYATINYLVDYGVQALGIVNGSRQIDQVFVPLMPAPNVPATSSTIFQTLLQQEIVGCTVTTGEGCITPADLTQFGITVTETGPLPPESAIISSSRDFQNPYSQQASFGIEREIGRNLSVSADYVFARTLKITRTRDKNLLPPPIGSLGIPQWSTGYFINPSIQQDNIFESTARAFYDGFILEVKGRFSRRSALFASYTLSKAIDEVTDFNTDFQADDQLHLHAERALSAFDQRHKLVLAGVLESPWQGGKGAPTPARLFSGFTLSPVLRASSGRPFNLLAGADINGDHHSTTDRPPFAGRNTGRGPGFWTFDLRLARRIAFGEPRSLELISEAFNLFNRTNFASVNNTVGIIAPPFNLQGRRDRTPSQPLGFTSALEPRRIQLGFRFNF